MVMSEKQGAGGGGERRSALPSSMVFVDDEPAVLSSLKTLFQRQRCVIHCFTSGNEALEFLRHHHVDVLVADLRMQEMNGIELLNLSSGINPDVVRVIMSGQEDKSLVLNVLARGLAHHYVLKPWDDAGFVSLVQETLRAQRTTRVRELFGAMPTLPAPPKSLHTLRSVLSGNNHSLGEIVREIEKTPPLVAKLLQISNSVYYATRATISSIREAVMFIGTEYIAALVTGIEAFDNVSMMASPELLHHVEDVWNASVRRARLARLVADRWKGFSDPHLAYMTSLLQDIGYVIRMSTDPRRYKHYLALHREGGHSLYVAEVLTFGIPHDEVGAALLEYWNLPPKIVDAIRRHHTEHDTDMFLQILQTADQLQCNDLAMPHDPVINGALPQWKSTLADELAMPAEDQQTEAQQDNEREEARD